ncbi:MAG: hypothetical protein M3P51_17140 [Chloroflexota bacterium]|nr:hypothetical protein [Chloroflexota bacterium]
MQQTSASEQGQQAGVPSETWNQKNPQRSDQEARSALAQAAVEEGPEGSEPDVLLDVPVLKVDEICLEVDELQARVSLHTELANMLRLDVGADVRIGKVKLEIKGVEAQALLKVRLKNVVAILDRAVTTIDSNPEILKSLLQPVGETLGQVGQGAGRAVGKLGEGAGQAVGHVGQGAGQAVGQVGQGAGQAVGGIGQGAGQVVQGCGQAAGRAVDSLTPEGQESGEASQSDPATNESGNHRSR